MSYPDLLRRFCDPIDTVLRAFVGGESDQLYRMMEYQLGWVDQQGEPLSSLPERPRGALCMGAFAALAGPNWKDDWRNTLPAAVAVELVYEFTRVHEAMQGGAPGDESRPNGWWLWGPAQAINVGDGLHMMGRLILLRQQAAPPERTLAAVRILDEACLDLLEGQQAELRLQRDPAARPSDYLAMCERQTGALLGCALQLGGLYAGAGDAAQEALRDAGRALGAEMRLWDDVAVIRDGGDPRDVVRHSFPALTAIESAPVAVKREVGMALAARSTGRDDAERFRELVADTGALAMTGVAVGLARNRREAALARADMSDEGLADLSALADYLAGDAEQA